MGWDCYCDYDAPDFFWSRWPKARKQHRCDECGNSILPGDKYECVTGKWDGYISCFRTCEKCRDLLTWLTNNLPCFCWAYGGAFEDASEAINEACWRAPEETKGLRFGYWRKVVEAKRFHAGRRASLSTLSPSPVGRNGE